MSVLGYRTRDVARTAGMGSRAAADDRATPAEVFGPLNERFRFTVDAAASEHNTKCGRYWTARENGLVQSWAGERVWCNPPYSHPNLGRWAAKARQQREAAVIVMLVPANRTEQDRRHEHVEPFRDRPGSPLRVEFLPGRIRFLALGRSSAGSRERTPFGCCLLIWNGSEA